MKQLQTVLPDLAPSPRYRFIDGLRGLAALSVMLHHAFHTESFAAALGPRLAGEIHSLAEFGSKGVQVFFVISGFVIALGLRERNMTAASLGNFFARRQIRLSPAYWIVMLLAFVRIHGNWASAPHALARPHFSDLLLNAFYLNGIADRPRFLGSAWTLCIEMQFYAVFGFIMLLNSAPADDDGRRSRRDLAPTLMFALGLISAWSHRLLHEDMNSGWFSQTFNMFALGVLAFWALSGRCRAGLFWILLGAVLFDGLWYQQNGMVVAAGAGLLIYSAASREQLGRWLSGSMIQYFGTISYSLYLIHNEEDFMQSAPRGQR